MKAVRVNEWGKPVQTEDVPQPIPSNDEVLVRIHAASINPFDTAVLAGYMAFMATPPLTLGTDFAGEVVAVGADITHVVRVLTHDGNTPRRSAAAWHSQYGPGESTQSRLIGSS